MVWWIFFLGGKEKPMRDRRSGLGVFPIIIGVGARLTDGTDGKAGLEIVDCLF